MVTGIPKTELPPTPNCSVFIPSRMTGFVPGESLTMTFPVAENYTNPGGSMQGGIISAAFDNVFGPLCYVTTKTGTTTTMNINTAYHRPIFPGDELTIIASVKSKGRTAIYMVAEAYNRENKLIATANTTYVMINRQAEKERKQAADS
jgi:uncharacterized protein (TIGR00369 family)